MTFDEKNQIVILKDASFIDVFALIEFIYKGEVNIGQVSICLNLQYRNNFKVIACVITILFNNLVSFQFNYRIDFHLC